MKEGTGEAHTMTKEGTGDGQGLKKPISRVRGRRNGADVRKTSRAAYIEQAAGARPRQP